MAQVLVSLLRQSVVKNKSSSPSYEEIVIKCVGTMNIEENDNIIRTKNAKRRRLRVDDPDFAPPDGGWGWLVVFACGFSNLSTFPMFQQFGLVFKDKLQGLGVSETQITTIINLTSAFNAIMGGCTTTAMIGLSLERRGVSPALVEITDVSYNVVVTLASVNAEFHYLCFGVSFGIVQSSNALALNTYFKTKRRIATGLSWTTTALGPIIWPYIIVSLNELYGMEGTLLMFSGIALHSFVGALLLQPEEVPEKSRLLDPLTGKAQPTEGSLTRIGSRLFSSQYFACEDDTEKPGYEIVGPGTPRRLASNDGWYSQSRSQVGSRLSLSSSKALKLSTSNSVAASTRPSCINLTEYEKERKKDRRERKVSTNVLAVTKEVPEENINEEKDPLTVPVYSEKYVLKKAAKKLAEYENGLRDKEVPAQAESKHLSIWRKISIFFDFELFKDMVYVNIVLGMTIANFAEINFSILTPIILAEFSFAKYEIASFMSLLGLTDVVLRFTIPFVADKIGWSNRTFFVVGVMCMALGRIIHTQTYASALAVAVMIGAGKALRTIFLALCIPSHVPLERLPAASGLQLAVSGIIYVTFGPLLGWIRQLFIAVPMSLNYGLVFRSSFSHLGLSATQGSVVLSMNAAFGMLTGLINGPLLNRYGYRKISFVGATLMTTGLFLEKRDRAVSLSMTISGLGPIVMPQVINQLMEEYSSEGVTLILAGICTHSFVAACLLQPVKYHQRKIVLQEMQEMKKPVGSSTNRKPSVVFTLDDEVFDEDETDRGRYGRKDSVMSLFSYEQEAAGLYGIDSTLVGSSAISLNTVRIPALMRQNTKTKYQWWRSASTINLESSYNIFDEKPIHSDGDKVYNELSMKIEEKTRWRRFLDQVILFFDLDLLKDGEYCIIMVGISVAVFAEINFSVLTVFILNDYGMDTGEIAEFLSVVAAADITFRFLAPYVDHVLKQPPRVVYLLSLVALVIIRSVIFLIQDVRYLFGIALALGCVKGVRIVNMYLIIPNYVPLDRLASASGIQMVANGLTILIWSPLIGVVEDLTGSYQACILLINAATSLTVILWSVKLLMNRIRRSNTEDMLPDQSNTLMTQPN
nr:unnamed protein product [Callosobruchus chinensis]